MNKAINYSIIIPHNNIPQLLKRCLDSIPRREDIQIIVVDDNSDINKVDFDSFPGLDDPYVEVIFTKEGRGAGYARNVGLRHAKGKWLLFADADDFYNDGFLSVLDCYRDGSFDIIYFGASSVDSETLVYSDRSVVLNRIIDDCDISNVYSVDFVKYTNWVPWNKMFKHDFVKEFGLCFEEIKTGNDALFVIKAGWHSRELLVIKDRLYCVTYRSDSLSYSVNIESFFCSIDMRLRLNHFFSSIGKSNFRDPLYGAMFFAYSKFGLSALPCFLKLVGRYNQLPFLIRNIVPGLFRYVFKEK